MTDIDCNNSKYKDTSLCICKKGIDAYIDSKNEYDEARDKFEEDERSWNEWNNINTQRIQITGDYLNYYNTRKAQIQNDTRDTKNYMDIENARNGNHDDYCINDFGIDWINIPENTNNINTTLKYSHPGFYFLKCQRTDTAIDRIIKEELLTKYPASSKTNDQRQEWTENNRPVFSYKQPNPLNITCCTQIIDDIKAGNNVDINNISQKCGNSTEAQENIQQSSYKYIKNYYIYIYIILCILLLLFIISSIVTLFSSGENEIYENF